MMGRRATFAGMLLCVVALAACNNWGQPGFDSGRSASNPNERAIGPSTVASLHQHVIPKMRDGNYGRLVLTMGSLLLTEPVTGRVRAFSATTCPRADDTACPQLWEYAGRLMSAGSGAIYVAHGSTSFTFEAIDTSGVRVHRYDSGVTAGFGIDRVVPTGEYLVAHMYLPTSPVTETLFVFPRTCGQLTCTPIANLPLYSEPETPTFLWSVSNLVVYSAGPGAGGRLTARNLVSGATLWTTAEPAVRPIDYRVKDGRVYTNGGLVYDAASRQGCSGTPKVCAPIRRLAGYAPTWWYDASASISGSRAVAGYAYGAGADEPLGFWSTDGSGCSGSPAVCAVHARSAETVRSPVSTGSLAFGIHVDPVDGHSHLQAYDLANTSGCSGAPLVCRPVADFDLHVASPFTNGYLAVAGGRVYVSTTDGAIHVFTLPGDVD